jgi:hypothetical protein
MLYVLPELYILTARAALHHLTPLAFALHPHRKRGRMGEIQGGGKRVQEGMGGAFFSKAYGRGRYCVNLEMFFQFVAERW